MAIETVRGNEFIIHFNGSRCIHSRNCVLDRPDVFVPNVKGEWIYPDRANSEAMAQLAHNCPSGAIRYERVDGGKGEEPPLVNTVRVRENGPLAIHAPLTVDGEDQGLRLTLCRCGQSKRKPYCDGSHTAAGFRATGEPAQQDSQVLETRNGPVSVKPKLNGQWQSRSGERHRPDHQPRDQDGPMPLWPFRQQALLRWLACQGRIFERVRGKMGKGRLEAFSDGVIAIIITIMVLELKIPHSADLSALWELGPVFLSYILSFAYVGIYWNNHHHLLHATKHVSGAMLWANLHLLFWLSLFPFTTGWMGENHFATWPVIVYGTNLLLAAMAYTILVRCIIGTHGRDSDIAKAIGSDLKGNVSIAAYLAGIAVAFYNPWISGCLFLAVALMWFIPDRRIERVIKPS